MSDLKLTKLEQFERGVVLRSARFLPLLLSFVATLMLIGAALTLLYSFTPSSKPSEPSPAPEPPQIAVSGSDINSYLNPSTPTAKPSTTGEAVPVAPTAEPAVSKEATAIATEVQAIRKQGLALNIPWQNKYQTVCAQRIYNYCYGQKTVLVSTGVSGYIDAAFRHHTDRSKTVETVKVDNESYRINPSQSEAKLAILKELEGVLAAAPPTQAHKVLSAWGKIREEREESRAEAIRAEQERITNAYNKAQAEYEVNVAKKQQARNLSATGIAMALGGFVLLGLILAVLAIERHTRLLEIRNADSITTVVRVVPIETPTPSL